MISASVPRSRRAQPRAKVTLAASVTSDLGSFPGTVRDIGIGGMFIEADFVPEYGKHLEIELTLDPHGPAQRLPAVVRWTQEGGFGVQLLELDARATHAIAELVQSARLADT